MFFQEEMPVEFNKNVAGSGSDVEKNLCFELNFLSVFGRALRPSSKYERGDIITKIREIYFRKLGPLAPPPAVHIHVAFIIYVQRNL